MKKKTWIGWISSSYDISKLFYKVDSKQGHYLIGGELPIDTRKPTKNTWFWSPEDFPARKVKITIEEVK